ncbi:MAG: ORF6N domain-containing protein [Verrucomicrobiota bacterium]
MTRPTSLIPVERIQRAIYLIRGEKVMLDSDLATLYGVSTKVLNRAVKRNVNRFPKDFMVHLSAQELEALRCQIGTSNTSALAPHSGPGRGGRRYLPYAFTEQGVAMLSTVLRSERAVLVNIAIMRAFVQLRQVLGSHAELARKLTELEQRIEGHDTAIRSLFDAIRQLMAPPAPDQPPKEIGFHVKEDAVPYRTGRRKRSCH